MSSIPPSCLSQTEPNPLVPQNPESQAVEAKETKEDTPSVPAPNSALSHGQNFVSDVKLKYGTFKSVNRYWFLLILLALILLTVFLALGIPIPTNVGLILLALAIFFRGSDQVTVVNNNNNNNYTITAHTDNHSKIKLGDGAVYISSIEESAGKDGISVPGLDGRLKEVWDHVVAATKGLADGASAHAPASAAPKLVEAIDNEAEE
ncbi:hypothetical protein OPT61_g3774 [Boeremia exigua]|uniref:Uncharacterized protein n=1 Tax=Boeremia exigua TaxID=749465 RepID=A0ACC2IGI0_9PLEO|nr:hypothetical protein OPT61_g3774 [Boeremia exigua]